MNGKEVKEVVTQLLLTRNCAVAPFFQEKCTVPDEASEHEAIVIINRYWRDLLGRQPYDTMEARSYLIDNCSFNEWISLLERGILPEVCR